MIRVNKGLNDLVKTTFEPVPPEERVEGMSVTLVSDEDVVVPAGGFETFGAREALDVPDGVTFQVTGLSRHMRSGLFMPAGWVDPGYSGGFTLEIANHADVPRRIDEGEEAAKLVAFMLYERVEGYEGRFGDG